MVVKMKKKVGQFSRGRYCTICQHVWEWDATQAKEIKYPEMPSYGLEREQCPSCKESPRSFKELPGTLARERHKKLLQRSSTDNPKLLKK